MHRLSFGNLPCVLALGLGLGCSPAHAQVSIGETAPGFTLTAADGSSHSLEAYRGKIVVLEWINFECPFVQKHYSSGAMQQLQSRYTGKDVVWLIINSSATGKQGHYEGDELADRIAKAKINADAYLLDTKGEVGRRYGARTTPHMYVIDAKGVLVYQGAIDSIRSARPADISKADNYVALALDALLAGEALRTTQTEPYGCSVKY
ncbi:MAG: redoxin domain-containing protein [Acidobacteriota bacterium]|nr:MAG: redoxin domain-containing protein [Acidobacteriota bacterium]